MIRKFYYFRDRAGRPMITLCRVTRNDGLIGFGWAICSLNDNPCKKVGRHISFNRAVVSLTRGNGISCDDTQHIFRWKRRVHRVLAHDVIMSCCRYDDGSDIIWGFANLFTHNITNMLPMSMRP